MYRCRVLLSCALAAGCAGAAAPPVALLFSRLPSALGPRADVSTTSAAAAASACPDHPQPLAFAGGVAPAAVSSAAAAAVAALAARANATSVPGVAYDVRYGGLPQPLARGGAGQADRARGLAMRADTLLRIGSITKAFVAALAVRAAALGLLSLDAPLVAAGGVAADFAVRDPFGGGGGRDITWRHLLAQRSGLQRECPPGATTAAVLAALADTPLVAPVGSRPSYSNLGFALAGHLLAEVIFPGGATLDELLAEHILQPLGLTDTGTQLTPAVLARLAPSYDAAGDPVPHIADLGWMWPAGSMYSSAQNLTSFGAALLAAAAPTAPADGSATPLRLPPALARELLDVTVLLADGVTLVSLPWETQLVDSYVLRAKGGNIEAYSATLALVPGLDLAFSAIYNGGVDEGAATADAAAALIPALASALAAVAPPPSQGPAPADYIGVYAPAIPGSAPDAHVLVQEGYLMLVVPGFLSAPLDFAGPQVPDAFRVWIPPGTLSCNADFELAIRGEYALFGRDGGGSVDAVSMPGWAPGLVWRR